MTELYNFIININFGEHPLQEGHMFLLQAQGLNIS